MEKLGIICVSFFGLASVLYFIMLLAPNIMSKETKCFFKGVILCSFVITITILLSKNIIFAKEEFLVKFAQENQEVLKDYVKEETDSLVSIKSIKEVEKLYKSYRLALESFED